MKNLVLTLFLTLFAFNLYADDFSWCEGSPDKYQPSTTKIIVTRTSPCNQGDEAFMDFIPKFRTNKAFRNSRIRIAAEDEISKMSADCFENWHIIKAGKGVSDGARYYGTWFNISADQVCFAYGDSPVDPNAPWGGSGAYFRFQRIDGQWYLTSVMLAG